MIVKNPVFRQDIGGPWGTVPELLFEKKELISTLKLLLSSVGISVSVLGKDLRNLNIYANPYFYAKNLL